VSAVKLSSFPGFPETECSSDLFRPFSEAVLMPRLMYQMINVNVE
jgi:hypothetical protein